MYFSIDQLRQVSHSVPTGKLSEAMEKHHYTGHRKRLRKRFLLSKKGSLPDYEILEILLFAGNMRQDVKPLAKALLSRFGSIAGVVHASVEDLHKITGITDSVISQFKVVQEVCERSLKSSFVTLPIIDNWQNLLDYLKLSIGFLKVEQIRVLYMNHKNCLISDDLHENGTVNRIAIYPREIVKRALDLHASAVILVHNHPSGDSSPSDADISLTQQINVGLQAVDITLHDHIIIAGRKPFSFRKHGLL